jgi:hypothetical protein
MSSRLAADSSIMDHGVEATERVGPGGEVLYAGDGLDISDYDRPSLGQGAPGILCAIGITGMEDDPCPWLASSSPAIRPRPVVEPEMGLCRLNIFQPHDSNSQTGGRRPAR